MRQQEQKYFADVNSGRLNADDNPFALSPNEWVNMENMRTGTTDKGSTGVNESIGGTVMISQPQPSVNFITIGSVSDQESGRILYFQKNTSGTEDKIVCCYVGSGSEYDVITSSQVTGGLNFDKFSLIHSAKVVEGMLIFPDGENNEPRKINIEAGIKANNPSFDTEVEPYDFPLNFSEITLIKPPAILCPNITKQTDLSFTNNFIQNDSFQFAYQYEYYDGELSVVGSYSRASRLNSPSETYNKILVEMDTFEQIPSTVKIVRLIARVGEGKPTGSNSAFVVKTWDKTVASELVEIEEQNSATSQLTFSFYNNQTGEAIAQDDVIRPFDNVPIYSQTAEMAKNRLFLGNNVVGYDAPKTTSLAVTLANPVTISQSSQQAQLIAVAMIRFDAFDVLSRWAYTAWYVNIPYGGVSGYYAITSTEQTVTGSSTPPAFPAAPTTVATSNLTFRGTTISQVVASVRPTGYENPEYVFNQTQTTTTITGLETSFYNVFPQRSLYKMGVVFYDYAMRKCSVVNNSTSSTPKLYVKYTGQGIVWNSTNKTMAFATGVASVINIGDTVVINGTINSGTYTVASKSGTTITVNETVSTSGVGTGNTVEIYRVPGVEVTTADRDYPYTTAPSSFIWYLDNTNALSEIPDWAYYYSVVRTLNLRTRFFVQGFTNVAKYVTRDSEGAYQYDNNLFVPQTVAIGINTQALQKAGLGYVYTQGDQCLFQISNSALTYSLSIIGQDGNYVLLKAQDFGDLTNIGFTYELYTPYQTSEQEPYYEVGEIYRVSSPKTSLRSYEVTSGVLLPDSVVFQRSFNNSTYSACAMCANDLFYQRWDSDAGKVSIITNLGRETKGKSICFSDTIIPGTRINGTSTFRALNEVTVPEDCGSITKLQLTSKVQSEGTVMLSICEAETNSMYLGESMIFDSTGNAQFFSQNKNVIGTINTLRGNYGCTDPASVVEYRGNVYFFDAINGRVIQYSGNGLDAISNFKMVRFWRYWAMRYNSLTKQEIEAIGDRPYVVATVDPAHDELLISLPKLYNGEFPPPKGYLPDYPSTIYPFDILDYAGKTIVYKIGSGTLAPHWQGSYTFNTEYFATVQNRLFSFKSGLLFEHNQSGVQNMFYGEQGTSKIMFVSNLTPQAPKIYDNILSESNICPKFIYFYNNYPYQQASDLKDFDFVNLEGKWYSYLYRNKLVPTATGFNTDGLLTGERMISTGMYVMMEYSPTTQPLELRYVLLGFSISKGHNL